MAMFRNKEELKYDVFGSKKCPSCGGKLFKQLACKTGSGAVLFRKKLPYYVSADSIIENFPLYTCQNCGKMYRLEDLICEGKKDSAKKQN